MYATQLTSNTQQQQQQQQLYILHIWPLQPNSNLR
jgi:hypothetical protein